MIQGLMLIQPAAVSSEILRRRPGASATIAVRLVSVQGRHAAACRPMERALGDDWLQCVDGGLSLFVRIFERVLWRALSAQGGHDAVLLEDVLQLFAGG